jgi:hypothetical protein
MTMPLNSLLQDGTPLPSERGEAYRLPMRFQILDPLDVRHDGKAIRLGHRSTATSSTCDTPGGRIA